MSATSRHTGPARRSGTCPSNFGAQQTAKYERGHQEEGKDAISKALAQPALELPPPPAERQADSTSIQARRGRDTWPRILEREVVLLETEIIIEERPTAVPERAAAHPTPPVAPEKVDQPRRETRRLAKYQAYKCYTLQPDTVQLNKSY